MNHISQPIAAELAGITARRLRQLDGEDNPPPKNEKGQYPTRPYGDWLRLRWSKDMGVNDDGKLVDFSQERALLTRAQRIKCELEIDNLRGEREEEVADEWRRAAISARDRMLALPSRLRQLLALNPEQERLVSAEVDEALRSIEGDDTEE